MNHTFPSSVREMSVDQRAWVGSFIDAEGCVVHHHGTRYGGHLAIEASNTEIELISALLRAVGAGAVYYRLPRNRSKPQWRWYVHRKEDALALARQCAPYSLKCQRLLQESAK